MLTKSQTIERLKRDSYVLNEKVRQTDIRYAVSFDSFHIIDKTIESINEEIKETNKHLDEIKKRHEKYQQKAVNAGYEKPNDWPEGLNNERIKHEAIMHVRALELVELHKKRDVLKSEKTVVKNDLMLKYGPVQSCYGEPLETIDGQRVEKINDIMVIVDSNSPYHGMAVSDYRRYVSNPFIKQQIKDREENQKKRENEFNTLGKYKTPLYTAMRIYNINELPSWPTGVEKKV